MRRVVITGLGVISPVGNDVDSFWKALLAGTNGIGVLDRFDSSNFAVKIAAQVKDFDPTRYMDPKSAHRFALFTQFALAAAKQAVADCGIDFAAEPDPYRCGCMVTSGVGGVDVVEQEVLRMQTKNTTKILPLCIPQIIVNMAAGAIAIEHNLHGPNFGPVTACASGLHSIGLAYRSIKYGEADVILAGGAEAPLCPVAVAGFAALHALSLRNDDPAHACRPFDKDRNGFIMGEGGGVVVLEEYERAKARGAHVYGEVIGFGETCDAFHMTAPMEGGVASSKAIEGSLREAGIMPDAVGYVNAHGTSTPMNDRIETAALKLALGEEAARKVSISSTKSMTGHLLGGAGAIETVACLKVLETGLIPPTINYTTPDPDCDLDYTPNAPRERTVDVVLNNALGFGGHNACVAFRKI